MEEKQDKPSLLGDIMDFFFNLNMDGPGPAAGQEATTQKLHPAGRDKWVAREHHWPQELEDPNVLSKFFLWLFVPSSPHPHKVQTTAGYNHT